jgi:hypothetical protein
MQGRDAIDLVRADEGKVAHSDAPAMPLIDDRDSRDHFVGGARFTGLGQDLIIDRVDDLHMARQQPFQQRHRPGFQGFGQQSVIRIGDGVAGYRESLGPGQPMQVDKDAHQFGDRDGGMGIVELHRRLLRQRPDGTELVDVAADEILQ